uniref:Uncharacterized protein n=1 Tax=Anguilla anguilla TaxID=7936 RepID=A0A0E9WBG6_ANGAN
MTGKKKESSQLSHSIPRAQRSTGSDDITTDLISCACTSMEVDKWALSSNVCLRG